MAFPLCDLQWDYIFVKQHISGTKGKMWISGSVKQIGEGNLPKKKKKKILMIHLIAIMIYDLNWNLYSQFGNALLTTAWFQIA